MTNKEKKIKLLLLMLASGTILYLSFKLPNDEKDEIINNHYEVIGTVSSIGLKTISITYNVDNKDYFYTKNKPYSGLSTGEEFYTLVNKKNLNSALVYFSRPILDSSKYKFALVNALDIDKLLIDESELAFSYKVGKIGYDRIQKYEEDKRPDDLSRLKVQYRIDKPEIGYLVEK